MKHPYLVRLVYLVALQFVANATISIIDPFGRTIDTFANTEVTTIDEVLKGYIESANPPDACADLTPPTVPINLGMKKFVLVNGTSKCNLITKIRNVAAVGFDVAIVYNPFPEVFEYNITIPFPKSEVNLSVVIVLFEDGLLIENNYLYNNLSGKDEMIIEIIPTLTWVTTVLAVLILIGMALIPVCVYFLCRMIILKCEREVAHEHTSISSEENQDGQSTGNQDRQSTGNRDWIIESQREDKQYRRLLKSLNKKFPLVQFSTDDRFNMCVICITLFEVGEKIRILKCNHAYHTYCIDPWLLKKSAHKELQLCPMCKRKMFWENSVEVSSLSATESAPLLGSSWPRYLSMSGNYSGDHLAGAQGSVNQCPWIVSDEDNNA